MSTRRFLVMLVLTLLITACVIWFVLHQLASMERTTQTGPELAAPTEPVPSPLSAAEVRALRGTLPTRFTGVAGTDATSSPESTAPEEGVTTDAERTTQFTTTPVAFTETAEVAPSDADPSASEATDEDEGADTSTVPEPTAGDPDPAGDTTSGIQVHSVRATDVGSQGVPVARTIEGTIYGVDTTRQVFVLSGTDDGATYTVSVTSDTAISMDGSAISFADLTNGDIVSIDIVASETDRDVTAEAVRVVAVLQLF